MLSIKNLDSSKFFCRKALNFGQVIEATSLLQCFVLYYTQQTLMFPKRKEVAKGVQLATVTRAVSK